MTELAPCPVEDCDETVNYTDLIDHLYAQHDAMDLCATVADVVAELEAKVAEYYGTASGIGPGSCDMVREAARDLRDMADAVPGPAADTSQPERVTVVCPHQTPAWTCRSFPECPCGDTPGQPPADTTGGGQSEAP